MKIAVFAGSFDPPTLGHLDVIAKASKVFDRLFVGVARSSVKSALVSEGDRLHLLRLECLAFGNVEVEQIPGLTVEFAKAHGASWLVRAIRNPTDFDYELQLSVTNHQISEEGLTTWFVMPSPQTIHIASSFVREVFRNRGDISSLVSPTVLKFLAEK